MNEFKIKNGAIVSGSITGVTEPSNENSTKMASTAWVRNYLAGAGTGNIYTTDGTLGANRTVTLSTYYLDVVGSGGTTRFFANGRLGIKTTTDAGFDLDVNGTVRVSSNISSPVGTTGERFGSGATGTGTYPTVFGYNASANSTSVAIGGAAVGGTVGNANTVIGVQASSTDRGIAIGYVAATTGPLAIAIGNNSSAGFTNSVAIGQGSTTTAQNQFMMGSASYPLNLRVSGTTYITTIDNETVDPDKILVSSSGIVKYMTKSQLGIGAGGGGGTVTSVAALTIGTSGTDINSTVATSTTTPVITLNVPDASVTARGVVTTGTQSFVGLKTFRGTTASDNPTYGSELATTGSGTNWTGSGFSTGYTHTAGSTSALTTSISPSTGSFYKILISQSGGTAGSCVVTFGGYSLTVYYFSGVGTTILNRATTTGSLTLTPTSDFNGTVTVSIQNASAQTAAVSAFTDSTNTNTVLLKFTSNNLYFGKGVANYSSTLNTNNTGFGNNALANIAEGSFNTAVGSQALSSNAKNSGNTAIGNTSMGNATTGSFSTALGVNSLNYGGSIYNVAVGYDTLGSSSFTGGYNTAVGSVSGNALTSGSYNTLLGNEALKYVTTGSNNVAIGALAGNYYSTGTSFVTGSDNSIFIGHTARSSANSQTNQIVIGYNVVGQGSNTTSIGNSSTTLTYLYGAVQQTSVTSALLKADSTGKLVAAVAGTDYITALTDTLATVTARGASTTTQVTFSGSGNGSTTYSSVRFSGYNQGGGVGYHGVFELENTYGSGTNGKKFFRLDNAGTLQIINNAYTANIFNLTDAGDLTVTKIIKSGGTSSQLLAADGSVITAGTGVTISGGTINASGTGGGTVTSVSVVSANGFAGTVATASSTPAITLTTTITGILKGNGTAISAAVAGTDYLTSSDLSGYLTSSTAASTYQPLDADLTSIAGLSGTSGLLKKTAANTWTLDTSTYLTSFTETDPVFVASAAYGITATNITNWNTAYGWGNHASAGYLTSATAASTYQPLDADLTAIAGLAGTSGLLKKTAANTWTLDTNTYLTANQTITLSGAVTGSGSTSISTTLANSIVGIANLSATGTPSSSTYLRGDNTWATITTGGTGTVTSVSVVSANGFAGTVATDTTTPAITLSTTVTGILKGNGTAISAATAGTDYVIPSALSSYVPTTRTINTLALSADQTFATGTSGTDFGIVSSGTTHTFNIPNAGATSTTRGLVSSGSQTFYGAKTFNDNISFSGTSVNMNSLFVWTAGNGATSGIASNAVGGNTVQVKSYTNPLNWGNVIAGTGGIGLQLIRGFNATAPSSGTFGGVFGLMIQPSTITTSTGTIINSATFYVEGASTGATNNYSIWVDDGTVRLDGAVEFQGIASSTTSNVLYYDTTSKRVTYGTAPSGSGSAYTVTAQTANYTATATSGTLIVKGDTTGGTFTVTLPTAVGNTATIIVKKTAGSAGLVIDGTGTETIDGSLTATLNKVNESLTLISDNANWQIV